jgi:maltooligosyltrehalose trehalohydrolase
MNVDKRAFGARLISADCTRFRLWAPNARSVCVDIDGLGRFPLQKQAEGWFEAEIGCGSGALYRYHINDHIMVPDPAADAQAGDVHGASVVFDHGAYHWRHHQWKGRPWHEAVIYELHVGALGGFAGVTEQLQNLAELGVTAIELMPIAAFSGPHNWGYDGVLAYAPDGTYGAPDELKHLIDTAHGLGLMVFLDVVYNHFGPDGNYLGVYASDFYRHDRKTPWGDAIDFRRPQVRQFFIENAIHWIREYRFDGLRFDAVHAIGDNEFLMLMQHEIRSAAGPDRHVHLVLENEYNDAAILRARPDAPGFDGQWADDFHHCVHVLLTGQRDAYYEDFAKDPQKLLARCLTEGFAYQGETSPHRGSARGTPSAHLPTTSFVICLQNHDQIGNRAFGERLADLSHPGALRAATALLLMTPQIPLLFMGQEWAASTPFLYFSGYTDELAEAVAEGRRNEFAKFEDFADPDKRERIPDPNDANTFRSSVIDPAEMSSADHAAWLSLHRQLLTLRAEEICPRMLGTRAIEGIPVGETGVRAQWRLGDGAILTIAANLGTEPVPCAPVEGRMIFCTDDRTDPGTLPGCSAEVSLLEAGHA